MIPFSGLQGIVLTIVIRKAVVQPQFLSPSKRRGGVRLQDIPGNTGRTVSPVIEVDGSTFVIIKVHSLIVGKDQGERIASAFALVLIISGNPQEYIIFQREYIRKEGARLLHQGDNRSAAVICKGDELASFDGAYLSIAADKVPSGREFTHLLTGKIVFEENLVAGHKITFGVRGLNLLLLRCLLWAGGNGLLGFWGFFVLFSFFLRIAVQEVVHTFFHFAADVFFGGSFGSFTQVSQKALGIGRSAGKGDNGKGKQ